MFSITPSNFAALHPVHHLILDELIASAPHLALLLCRSVYKRVIPILYAHVHSTPALFKGLQRKTEYERTEYALCNTKSLSVDGSTSLHAISALSSGPDPFSIPEKPQNTRPLYPRPYYIMLPYLERLELSFSALQPPVVRTGPRGQGAATRIADQMPNDLREIVFHLDEGTVGAWKELNGHLMSIGPEEAVVFVKGEARKGQLVKTPDGGQKRMTFGRIGEKLPTLWTNGQLLRVFVGTQKPWDSLNGEEREDYAVSMSLALVEYAQGLFGAHIEGEEWFEAEQEESPLVAEVEFHLPSLKQVLAQMDGEGKTDVDALVRQGRLVLKEYDFKEVEALGELKWRW
ncbi:hypothetical protein L198_02486 [Cryptococcus wingfieldii CBS 7118]|uniref:F-box domain-containing protein n=1 Tax=Cryptococcus wingfieldii CBS 7118 TaxID=1295528 RepID=A0A1E3JS27_9TREE|nr:hypothetical protein L198_02486 [Cryptococcus wingfieldii CBS 7118]ODO03635.1 hypothetical protein L198_02486 [Cryptococcus wingfieldii CBS 7118]